MPQAGLTPSPSSVAVGDDELIDELQRAAFGYFLEEINPANGLIGDASREDSPVSIAVVGFALACYPVGVQRGWITRDEAVARCLAALRFFRRSDQSGSPDSTGYKGFYFHFLDPQTGARVWRSELSMIDTGLLVAGALVASLFFTADNTQEAELREHVDFMYRRIDWPWAQNGEAALVQGWKPECGFLHYGWEGYSEALMLYVLALGSPTHPITHWCHHAWTSTYQWENLYGHEFLYAGPLFMHQFSHAWIDFRGIQDPFMRAKDCDYFENSRRATFVQREYAQRNPYGFAGYSENCWGFTACDGPARNLPMDLQKRRRVFGYAARGVPYGPDDGTISGSAALASLPFAPDVVLPAVRHLQRRYPETFRQGRFAGSFNPSYANGDGSYWISPDLFGLDQGVVVLMIENYRTEMIWKLTRESEIFRSGLERAGFRGGWL
jgi:hypothetical protein